MSINPGFNVNEASEQIRIAVIATQLYPPEDRGYTFSDTEKNPYAKYDQPKISEIASPAQPVWPDDWGPFPGKTWKDSIVRSVLPGKEPPSSSADTTQLEKSSLGLVTGNTAIVAYNQGKGQYALSFAGTENKIGAIQDIAAIPVSAGPLLNEEKIEQRLESFFPKPLAKRLAKLLVGSNHYVGDEQTQADKAQVHLGFRLAFESLFNPLTSGHLISGTPKLTDVLDLIPDGSDLFVSGYSLGGGMSTIATAWLLSGNYHKRFNIKTYACAAPKSGNEIYANYLNKTLANQNLFYRVYNELDTVPQVPFTVQLGDDLNNPQQILALTTSLPAPLNKIADAIFHSGLPGGASLNYTHAGLPYPLAGEMPVVSKLTTWPAKYFAPDHDLPLPTFTNTEFIQNWWQHQPCVYLEILSKLIQPK